MFNLLYNETQPQSILFIFFDGYAVHNVETRFESQTGHTLIPAEGSHNLCLHLAFKLQATSPPGALLADFLRFELKAFHPEHVKVDVSDHPGNLCAC